MVSLGQLNYWVQFCYQAISIGRVKEIHSELYAVAKFYWIYIETWKVLETSLLYTFGLYVIDRKLVHCQYGVNSVCRYGFPCLSIYCCHPFLSYQYQINVVLHIEVIPSFKSIWFLLILIFNQDRSQLKVGAVGSQRSRE